jgi:hypothetical protein
MTRFVPDHLKASYPRGSFESDAPDSLSHGRLERLLRGAQDAAMLRHRLALLDIEAQHRLAWHRSHFDPNQPRVPAGHSEGGQWTRTGSAKDSNGPQVLSDVTPDNDWQPEAQYANARRPGTVPIRIGGQWFEVEPGQAARYAAADVRAQDAIRRVRELDPNWRPEKASAHEGGFESEIRRATDLAEEAEARVREITGFGPPPIIPKERPPTTRERNDVAREIARWLARNLGRVVEGAAWLDESEAAIEAYLDPPKTLEELQQAVPTPKKGYEVHHIVEQTPAEDDKFPRSMIDAPDNLVRIPKFKHWEITSWFMTKNKAFGNISPREYLRGESWDERTRVGLVALRKYGVLKP